MMETTIKKPVAFFTLWKRAIREALRAALLLGGLLYGGVIYPFVGSVSQHTSFPGLVYTGLIFGIPIVTLISAIAGVVSGLITTVMTFCFFYPLRRKKLYRLAVGVIALFFSVIGVSACLLAFMTLPYHIYETLTWEGSETILLAITCLSALWATYRFTEWYSANCSR